MHGGCIADHWNIYPFNVWPRAGDVVTVIVHSLPRNVSVHWDGTTVTVMVVVSVVASCEMSALWVSAARAAGDLSGALYLVESTAWVTLYGSAGHTIVVPPWC